MLIKICFYVKIAEIWIFRHSLIKVFWKLQSIRWPHNVIWGAWSKWRSYIYGAHWHYVFSMFWINSHCVKYARMLVFSDPYFRVESQNVCFCPMQENTGLRKPVRQRVLGSVGAFRVIFGKFGDIFRALLNSMMKLQEIVNRQKLFTVFSYNI